MYSFLYDYSEGCHPLILKALIRTNQDQQPGYGDDVYSVQAKQLIKEAAGAPNADVHFVSGGTQANLITINALLPTFKAVISAKTGHIHVNEAGAVEATGHKILELPSDNGKITADAIQQIIDAHDHFPHVVKPGMVYVSNATELGTIYSKEEFTNISQCCRKNDLLLFMDGARLGSALCADNNDLNLKDIARLADVFYIGGTKNGALLGEAIVICNSGIQRNFNFHLKQRGALLAKGRLLGIQFLTLFQDDLFFNLAKHANECAALIKDAAIESGFSFKTKPQTNQLFINLSVGKIKELEEKYKFYRWQKIDKDYTTVRIVTSWATDKKMVSAFIEDLKK